MVCKLWGGQFCPAILPAARFQRVQPSGKTAAAMIGRPTNSSVIPFEI